MKILIPILGFAKQGGYRVLSELANSWVRMGHECTFLAPATSDEPYFPTSANVIYCVKSGIAEENKKQKKASGFDNVFSLYAGLKIVGHKYDVIFANHSLTAWPVWLANCGSASKVYYVQAFEPGYYPFHKSPVKHVLSRLSYYLDLIKIVNSPNYPGVDSIATIPPGIDLSIFSVKQGYIDVGSKSEIVIGTIGRTEPYKGTATAIAAYRHLRTKYPNLKMKVGFGNVASSDDYDIIKIKNDHELAEFYQSIDVLLVTCYSQHGAPHYPLIEAMACGTPVIHTDYYPGNESNSWVAKSSDVGSVIDAVEGFFATSRDNKIEKIRIARKTIEDHLSWEKVANSFLEKINLKRFD